MESWMQEEGGWGDGRWERRPLGTRYEPAVQFYFWTAPEARLGLSLNNPLGHIAQLKSI